MSDAVIVALIVAVPALITSLTGMVIAVKKIDAIHVAINSRFDEFLALAKKSSFAEGVKAEKENPS